MYKLKQNSEKRLTGEELANILTRKLRPLFEEKGVDFAYLGGSWVNNQHHWWSDIDIFISVPHFLQLSSDDQLEFQTIFHLKATDLTKFEEIEISILEILPLHVQFNVFQNGILLFETNPEITASFLEKLLPLYYDHKIWYESLIAQSKYVSKSKGKEL